MTPEELIALTKEESRDDKISKSANQEEDEEDPEWADVNLEEVKRQEAY